MMSDSAIMDRIHECENALRDLEKSNNRDEQYYEARDQLLYEIECWERQLEFGTVSIW